MSVACTTLPSQGPYHLTGTYDGTAVRIYVDGVLKQSKPSTTAIKATNGELFIGSAGGGFNWVGTIDEVRIWNRALTANEVKQVYDGG